MRIALSHEKRATALRVAAKFKEANVTSKPKHSRKAAGGLWSGMGGGGSV
ncbi:MAG: hypothetical protein LBC27_05040 [Spirochaetaceae bacterium]|nr:hypothetical protein [Spirochaetaceae bacterium]